MKKTTLKSATSVKAVAMFAFVAMGMAAVPALAAGANQVEVCHSEGNGASHLINVNQNAMKAHNKHGDDSCRLTDKRGTDRRAVKPSVPRITSPEKNGVVTAAELTKIDWTDAAGRSKPMAYQYESYRDANYTDRAYASDWLAASEINTPNTPDGKYYVRVRAKDQRGNLSAWSNGASRPYLITVDESAFERAAKITSPKSDGHYRVGSNLTFAATLRDKNKDDSVQWAVRKGTCAAGTGTVFGNVDGRNDSFRWKGTSFSASVDTDHWTKGKYCFVFNPTESAGDANVRQTVEFTLN